MSIDVIELMGVAEETAVATAQLILQKWSQPRTIKSKGFRDLVTDTDVAAQKLITDTIQARFPTHGFLTEEDDGDLPTSGPVIWVIDPVDGTTNFSRAVPSFCVSLGAVSETGDLLAGAVYDPMRGELFSAARHHGAWLRDPSGEQRPLTVSQVDSIADVLFGIDWSRNPDLRQIALRVLAQIAPQVQDVRAVGSAALALCWLAAGRFDGYANMQLSPWDLAAACLIIQEAGGQISEPTGEPWHYSPLNSGVIASNGRIHQTLLENILPITQPQL